MKLELIGPEGQVISFPSKRFTIGASALCDVRFLQLQSKQLEISEEDGRWRVRDISNTGTLQVNGVSALEALLTSGAVINAGGLELRVRKVQAAGQRTEAVEAYVPGRLEDGTMLGGRYKIMDFIAEGGMGEVYRAEHLELGKSFAVKVMRPELSNDEDFVARFKQEAIAASRIGHKNIVATSDFGLTANGRLYIVMEYLVGETLHDLLSRGAMDPIRVRHIGLQAARALGAAHHAGILHRDLKPENIMVVQRPGAPDFVKVLDFGAAKDVRAAEGAHHTELGMVVGTPSYMSPEQAAGLPVDARTDVYALGLILYELLVGKQTYDALTPSRIQHAHLQSDLPPLPPLPDLDDGVAAIVNRMVSLKIHERPMTMDLVIAKLELPAAPAPFSTDAVAAHVPADIPPSGSEASLRARTPAQSADSEANQNETVPDDDYDIPKTFVRDTDRDPVRPPAVVMNSNPDRPVLVPLPALKQASVPRLDPVRAKSGPVSKPGYTMPEAPPRRVSAPAPAASARPKPAHTEVQLDLSHIVPATPKRWPWVVVGLCLLAGAAAGYWWFALRG